MHMRTRRAGETEEREKGKNEEMNVRSLKEMEGRKEGRSGNI